MMKSYFKLLISYFVISASVAHPAYAQSEDRIMLCGFSTQAEPKKNLVLALRHATTNDGLIDADSAQVHDPNNMLGGRTFTKFVRDGRNIVGTVGEIGQGLPMFFTYAPSPDNPKSLYASLQGPVSTSDLTVVSYTGACGYPPAADVEVAWNQIRNMPPVISL